MVHETIVWMHYFGCAASLRVVVACLGLSDREAFHEALGLSVHIVTPFAGGAPCATGVEANLVYHVIESAQPCHWNVFFGREWICPFALWICSRLILLAVAALDFISDILHWSMFFIRSLGLIGDLGCYMQCCNCHGHVSHGLMRFDLCCQRSEPCCALWNITSKILI